ncbi:hypothetical protein AgCh_027513 [Apium graveolens]
MLTFKRLMKDMDPKTKCESTNKLKFPVITTLALVPGGQTLFPSRAWANVSRVGVYQGSACGTELVRSGSVRDYSLQELRGVMSLGVGVPGAELSFSALGPEFVEFGESGLRWLSLAGVELCCPQSGVRWVRRIRTKVVVISRS